MGGATGVDLEVKKRKKNHSCCFLQTFVSHHSLASTEIHFSRKYARIFVRGQYLFRGANSFPKA